MPKPPGLEDDVIRDVRQRFEETTAEQNQIKADLATFGNLAHDALTKLQESDNMVNANFNQFQEYVQANATALAGTVDDLKRHVAHTEVQFTATHGAIKREIANA